MMINFKFLGFIDPSHSLGLRNGAKPTVKQINVFSTSSLRYKPDLDNNSVDIKPVIKYDNACEDKLKILKENKNKSGIYR
jgi:hypothetical protein